MIKNMARRRKNKNFRYGKSKQLGINLNTTPVKKNTLVKVLPTKISKVRSIPKIEITETEKEFSPEQLMALYNSAPIEDLTANTSLDDDDTSYCVCFPGMVKSFCGSCYY